jgi:large subunit ribosomal protein L25
MTTQRSILKAEKRTELGRKKVKKLRKEGLLPASIYGKDFKSISLALDQKETHKLFKDLGTSQLLDLEIKGEKETFPVLFKNPHHHPVTDDLLHIDFYKVNLKEKITARVPLEFVGISPAVEAGNVLLQIMHDLEVEVLPTDLPENFVVDLSLLKEIGDTITIADLKIDPKIAVQANPVDAVAKVEEPKKQEEVAPVVEEGEEGEEGEQKTEGEAPKEGEKPAEETKTEEAKE